MGRTHHITVPEPPLDPPEGPTKVECLAYACTKMVTVGDDACDDHYEAWSEAYGKIGASFKLLADRHGLKHWQYASVVQELAEEVFEVLTRELS